MTAPSFDGSGETVILSKPITDREISNATARREFEGLVEDHNRRYPRAPRWRIVEDGERIAIIEAARNAGPKGAVPAGTRGD